MFLKRLRMAVTMILFIDLLLWFIVHVAYAMNGLEVTNEIYKPELACIIRFLTWYLVDYLIGVFTDE